MTRIGIVGCGWFGLPLARQLLASGYVVKGTKTTSDGVNQLAQLGIESARLDLNEELEGKNLVNINHVLDVDILVVNIPPKLRNLSSDAIHQNDYLLRLSKLKTLIGDRQYQKFIFISTTGVYPDDGIFEESEINPWSDKSQILLQAETFFEQQNTCIVRFAGLIGNKRHPARFLSGKKGLTGGSLPVNLVHLDDCIGGIEAIIKSHQAGGIYNLVSPHHPSRSEFYTKASFALGLMPPEFTQSQNTETDPMGKIVNGQRIVDKIGYQYKHSNLLSSMKYLKNDVS